MSRKIPVINGLRGWAIMTVIFFHIYMVIMPMPGQFPRGEGFTEIFLKSFILNGSRAVDLFFILSAFVLVLPYLRGERSMKTLADVKWFYTHRAARLLPLYYFHVILLMLVINPVPMHFETVAKHLLLMGTFLFHFDPQLWMPQYNAVIWSIGVEFWFCVLLPFILMAINRYGMLRTIVAMFIISLTVRYFGVFYLNSISINHISDSVYGRMDNFATGIVLAYAYIRGMKPFGSYAMPLGLVLLLAGFSFRTFMYLNMLDWIVQPLVYQLNTAGFFLLIIGALHARKGVLHFFMANYPIQLAGLMCYSLYLWHNVGRTIIKPQLNHRHLALYLFFVFVISWLSYRYIEFGRVKDWKSLLPARRSAPVPDSVPVQQTIAASPLPA